MSNIVFYIYINTIVLLSNLVSTLFKGTIKPSRFYSNWGKKHQQHYYLLYASRHGERQRNVQSPQGGSKTLYMNVHTRTRSLHSCLRSDSYSLKQFMNIFWLRHQRATVR